MKDHFATFLRRPFHVDPNVLGALWFSHPACDITTQVLQTLDFAGDYRARNYLVAQRARVSMR
jgi:hypothetical protein